MRNLLFKKFDYYWFCLVFTVIWGFGFFLTNHSMGADDELFSVWADITNIVYIERIGRLIYAKVFQTFEYLPFWREFLAIAIYTVGITVHAQNFMEYLNFENFKFDKKMATIFSCVAISFPYMALPFIFMVTCLEQAVNTLLSAVAVNCFYIWLTKEKKKCRLITAILLVFFTISVYEISIFLFLIPCLFIQLVNLIYNNEYKIKTAYKQLALLFSVAIASNFINFITVKIFHRIIIPQSLERYNEFFAYDMSSLKNFFISFIEFLKDLYLYFTIISKNDFGTVLIGIAMIAFLIYILVQCKKQKKDKHISLGYFINDVAIFHRSCFR